MREELLHGAYDLHVHTAPDVVPRKVNHLEAAQRCLQAGMKGFTINSQYALTTDFAEETMRAYPECNAISGIVLNTTVGGINPIAAEYAFRRGAKIVWFPTMDAPKEQAFIIKHAPDLVSMQIALSRGHIAIPDCSLLDERGELRQSAKDVVTVAKKHNAVVATGHISHEECFAVAQEAYRQGVEKLVITHANLPATRYSVAEQKKLIDLGAIIERSYIVLYKGMIDAETEAAEIAAVGADHVFLSSDFGRPEAPFFDEGLLAYINALCDQGVSEQDTYRMVSVNPTYLVE